LLESVHPLPAVERLVGVLRLLSSGSGVHEGVARISGEPEDEFHYLLAGLL
jgi:hypothetical protein